MKNNKKTDKNLSVGLLLRNMHGVFTDFSKTFRGLLLEWDVK